MYKAENSNLLGASTEDRCNNSGCSSGYGTLSKDENVNDLEFDYKTDSNDNSRLTVPTSSMSFTWLGYVFCILSGFCFISCNFCIKLASSEFPVSTWQLLFVRCSLQLVTMIPILCFTKSNIFGSQDIKTKLRLGAQAAVASGLVLCYFEGIRRLPLGDFGAITFSSPAFTMVLSIFLLKEHCGLYRIIIATTLIVGVVLISRPSALFPNEDLPSKPIDLKAGQHLVEKKTNADVLGVVFALTGAILSAWVTILARQVNHVHFSVQVLWSSLSGMTISLMGMFLIETTNSLFSQWNMYTWLLSAGQAVLGLVGTILILKALKWISPTRNKVIRSFQVVGSYIIQVEAFGTIPHVTDYVGAALIVVAVVAIALEEKIVKILQHRSRYL